MIRNKIHLKNYWFFVLSILFLTIYSDQYTKLIAVNSLANREPFSILSGTIVFSYAENSAGFLGMLNGYPDYIQFFLLNICVSLLLLFCIFCLFYKKMYTIQRASALAAITGGGMSNLFDRVFNSGKVIDFLQLDVGLFTTGIFNLADIYILTGSFILGFFLLSTDS